MARTTRRTRGRKPKPGGARRTAETASRRTAILVATRKGAWLFHGDAARRSWRVDGPYFLGHIVNHVVLDPRDGRTLLAAPLLRHHERRALGEPR